MMDMTARDERSSLNAVLMMLAFFCKAFGAQYPDFLTEGYSLCDSVVLESDVLGEAAHLAGDPLHALLALHHRHVDVVHPLHHVSQWRSWESCKPIFNIGSETLVRFWHYIDHLLSKRI